VNEGDVQSTPERERARTTPQQQQQQAAQSDTSSTGSARETPPQQRQQQIHRQQTRLPNGGPGPGHTTVWEERDPVPISGPRADDRKRIMKPEITDLADVMQNLRPCKC
jgi:hypothetical protein